MLFCTLENQGSSHLPAEWEEMWDGSMWPSQDLMALLTWLGSTLAAFLPHGSSSQPAVPAFMVVSQGVSERVRAGPLALPGPGLRPHRPSLPPQTKSESSPVRRGREISPLFVGRAACFQSVVLAFSLVGSSPSLPPCPSSCPSSCH